ncbi:HNH endonuclease signature motif containing protein, partial [Arthrobacter ginkgonis]|uniref:HNH endonuclease signature motif containing protein n=1 Tax=Arthrobacter ginkgonis TaxID=1630594 RepID=UPI0031EB3E0B
IPGEGHRAAELNGHGPIDDASARRLAAQTPTWTRLYATPGSLAVVGMDHHRYRPTPAQRRALWAADQTCRFPGCRRNALACEPDHVHEHHHGGPTELGNLASLCRKHHTYKTLGLWKTRIGADRTLEFTSPAGRTYRTDPPLPWQDTGHHHDPPQDTQPHDAPKHHQPPTRQHHATTSRHESGDFALPGERPSAQTATPRPAPRTASRRTGWDSPDTDDGSAETPPF